MQTVPFKTKSILFEQMKTEYYNSLEPGSKEKELLDSHLAQLNNPLIQNQLELQKQAYGSSWKKPATAFEAAEFLNILKSQS